MSFDTADLLVKLCLGYQINGCGISHFPTSSNYTNLKRLLWGWWQGVKIVTNPIYKTHRHSGGKQQPLSEDLTDNFRIFVLIWLLFFDSSLDEMHCLSRKPSSYLLNSYSDFQETDEIARESYEATWLDLLMETRPEYKYAFLFPTILHPKIKNVNIYFFLCCSKPVCCYYKLWRIDSS